MQTFSEWYHSIPEIDRPQFTDQLNNGAKYRIVYSTDPALWCLTDYKVSSQLGGLVHLVKKQNDKSVELRVYTERAFTDLAVLAGDVMGGSDETWQERAKDAVQNLRGMADTIESMIAGGSFPVFPSPAEVVDDERLDPPRE